MVAGRVKEFYAKEAEKRRNAGLKKGGEKPVRENLPPREEQGKARDKAGEALGVSGKTVTSEPKLCEGPSISRPAF